MDTLRLYRGRRSVMLLALLLVILITPGASSKETSEDDGQPANSLQYMFLDSGILDSLLLIGPAFVSLPIYQTLHVIRELRIDKIHREEGAISTFSELRKLYGLYRDTLQGSTKLISGSSAFGGGQRVGAPQCGTPETYRFDAHACTMEHNWSGATEEGTLPQLFVNEL